MLNVTIQNDGKIKIQKDKLIEKMTESVENLFIICT